MRRRDLVMLLGGAAAQPLWPLMAQAQQPAVPLVALVSGRGFDNSALYGGAFRKGLGQAGYVEPRNVSIQFNWLDGQYNRVPALIDDLARQGVAVVAAPGAANALATAAATTTIPIVFGVGEDPVKLGLVRSLARPGGNATGVNFLLEEVVAKELGLLHELLPKAARIAVLVNPANASNAASTLRDLSQAARSLGLQIRELRASTSAEIDAALATAMSEHADALLIGPDAFMDSRRVQITTSAIRYAIPAVFSTREAVEIGGLMSYGTDLPDTYRQIGDYVGRILKGAKPADLPVIQSAKFEFVLNLQTAKLFGIEVPPSIVALADSVIE
jgi:putative tryptophan/tyrosine transport system substrate-binding protein